MESEENIKRRLGICPYIDDVFYEECCCLCDYQVEIWTSIGAELCDRGDCQLIGYGCYHKYYYGKKVLHYHNEKFHGGCELFERRK